MKGPVDVTLSKVTPCRPCWWYYDGEVGVVRIGHAAATWSSWRPPSPTETPSQRPGSAPSPAEAAARPWSPASTRCAAATPPAWTASGGSSARVSARPTRPPRSAASRSASAARTSSSTGPTTAVGASAPAPAAGFASSRTRWLGSARSWTTSASPSPAASAAWGLHVARPAELTDLFARAYGKVVDAEETAWIVPERYRMGQDGGGRGRAGAREAGACGGEGGEEGPTLERMARGPEMGLKRSPAETAEADWGGSDLGEEEF